jgi:hypothetical protein
MPATALSNPDNYYRKRLPVQPQNIFGTQEVPGRLENGAGG